MIITCKEAEKDVYYASGLKFLLFFPSELFRGGFPFLALSKSVFSSFIRAYN